VTPSPRLRHFIVRLALAAATATAWLTIAAAHPASAEGYCVEVYPQYPSTGVTVCTPWN